MGDELGPFEKILKYIQEQKKMPHVATNIALKELTWPPANKPAPSPSIDVSDTFPSSDPSDKSETDSTKDDEVSEADVPEEASTDSEKAEEELTEKSEENTDSK